jgi:hypothetical protein
MTAYSQTSAEAQDAATETRLENRREVPNASARAKSYTKIKEIYLGRVTASKDDNAKAGVAASLMADARETTRPSDKYALFEYAATLYGEAGNIGQAFAALDELGTVFEFDAADAKRRLAFDMVKTGPSASLGEIVSQLVAIARSDLGKGRLTDAADAASQAALAARRAKDKASIDATTKLLMDIRAAQKIAARETKLVEAAQQIDAPPAAFRELGEFLCFVKDDWAGGAAYLARGDDAPLRKLAAAELKAPQRLEDRMNLAEGWEAFAGAAKAEAKTAALSRARHHYTEALPLVRGLEKARVEKKLADLAGSTERTSRWLVIFRGASPDIWNTDHQDDGQRFAVPVSKLPRGIRHLRMRNSAGRQVILALTAEQLVADVPLGRFGWQGTKRGFYGGVQLGIYDQQTNVSNQRGQVCIRHDEDAKALRSGWGFGTGVHESTTRTCWQGTPSGNEPIEIAITTQELTPGDVKYLLQ